MQVDTGFHSLLRNLKVDCPCTSPKTWESITAESGTTTPIDPLQGPHDTIYDLSSISEAFLVRLVINALQGVRSAIVEIDKLSLSFCLSPADRSFHRVPSLWCRLSSTHALGRMLKTFNHSSLLFFFLREFVNYFLCIDQKANLVRNVNADCPSPSNCGQDKREMKEFPPYSLVNQAFAVAVGKLLEGYICALNTLSTSIKLRRLVQLEGDATPINHTEGTLTSVVHSEMTFIEFFLHTMELRSHIEAIGNICFCQPIHQTLINDVLSLNSVMEFHKFPRGANLLSYLYVQFQDADPVHYSLLKYLFVHSYEPYSGFIKLWIYRATIDDPYGEFFVAPSDTTPTVDTDSHYFDNLSLAYIKSGVSVPFFLKNVCHQLLQAGQQLQVLVKLLDCCDLFFSGDYAPCDLSVLREILLFWVDSSSNLEFLSNPLSFDINVIEILIQKRNNLYRTMLEKLQNYFDKFSSKDRWTSINVISFGSMPFLPGGRNGMNISVYDDESSFIRGSANEACGDADSYESSSSTESAFETELSLSSECSTHNYSNESIDESLCDLQDNLCHPSRSMLSNVPANHAVECILRSYTKTDQPYFHQSFHTSTEHVHPVTSYIHHHHQNKKMNQIPFCSKFDVIKDLRTSEISSEVCQSGGCWPLGGLQSNPFCSYMNYRGPQQLPFIESCFEYDEGNPDKFDSEEISFSDAFGPVILNFYGSGRMQTSSCTFKSISCHSSTISWPYAFSMNPMLTKTPWLPAVCNSRDLRYINNNASHFPNFNFSSVTDPFKLHSVPLGSGYRSKAEASMYVQSGGSVRGLEHSAGPIKETVENKPITSLCYSAGETNPQRSAQLPNASGGADWTRSLRYPVKSATYSDRSIHSDGKFLVPLDIILDRCILQEILLQYKYIICFTIKFLEKGFNLQEHFLALRRYYFMEISDWADLFLMSLCSQSALDHEPTRIQELLDLALQRSSCENDPYKERLFICTKELAAGPPNFANGIHFFDFMVLCYRVDWPVNIVVTQGALKIYADIFSYLLQIRLAVTSLTDIWLYLKELLHSLKQDQHSTFLEMDDFNSLMGIRQHINHFATTLQQYVQFHLSDVSWYRFQDSLKDMVKCMLDLESVHMLYLADAVRLCFLSDDAKEVAAIIKNILQCALDFRLCFTGIDFTGRLYEKDKPNLQYQVNFTQVSTVNSTFRKSLKELYLLCFKWPNHSELSLHRFWNNLNYNNYYSAIINKD